MRVPAGLVNDVRIGRDRRFDISFNLGSVRQTRRANMRVLVMGAAADVGLACARAFAERNADLFLSDIDGPGLERTAAALDATGLSCDVSSEASVATFAHEVERILPSLDILINAAGRSYVRTLGTLRVTRALLPIMMNDDGARHVVNIADMKVGLDCGPFPYAASINAFQSLADAMSEKMHGSNVRLTTVLPLSERPDAAPVDPSASASWNRRLYCDHHDLSALARDVLAACVGSAGDRAGSLEPWRRSRSAI